MDPKAIILPYQDFRPALGEGVFIAPGAVAIGRLTMGAGASIWFGCVVRADVHEIEIGARTNIQDGTVVHVTGGKFGTYIGDDVTVGHKALLHGCTVGSRVLVGMGATIMDGVEIGDDSLVAAGSLVTPGKKFPPRSLIKGSPAKAVRELSDEEIAGLLKSAEKYVGLAAEYRTALGKSG